jgi:hypothetical protein
MPTSSTIRQEVESVMREAVDKVAPMLRCDDDEDAEAKFQDDVEDIDELAANLIELIVATRVSQEVR